MADLAAGSYWEAYYALPRDVQRLARAAFRRFEEDPNHPSFDRKKLAAGGAKVPAGAYQVRVGMHYRAFYVQRTDTDREWIWIASKEEASKVLRRRNDGGGAMACACGCKGRCKCPSRCKCRRGANPCGRAHNPRVTPGRGTFTVSFTPEEIRRVKASWPASGIPSRGIQIVLDRHGDHVESRPAKVFEQGDPGVEAIFIEDARRGLLEKGKIGKGPGRRSEVEVAATLKGKGYRFAMIPPDWPHGPRDLLYARSMDLASRVLREDFDGGKGWRVVPIDEIPGVTGARTRPEGGFRYERPASGPGSQNRCCQSLYAHLLRMGIVVENHETDLYTPDTEATRSILKDHGVNFTTFTSKIDGRPWLDVPFMYDPGWPKPRSGNPRTGPKGKFGPWYRAAYKFFAANAGGVVGENARIADSLARAEAALQRDVERGRAEILWEPDQENDTSWCDRCQKDKHQGEGHQLWSALLRIDRDVKASLTGIDFGPGDSSPDLPYRRIVEAELAQEAYHGKRLPSRRNPNPASCAGIGWRPRGPHEGPMTWWDCEIHKLPSLLAAPTGIVHGRRSSVGGHSLCSGCSWHLERGWTGTSRSCPVAVLERIVYSHGAGADRAGNPHGTDLSVIHLSRPRGGAVCGAGDSYIRVDADIRHVTCPACKHIADPDKRYMVSGGLHQEDYADDAINESPDPISARELQLFIDNDSQLYHSQTVPIQRNLMLKKKRGTYDHEKAVALWMYLVEAGAKKYAKDYGSPDQPWHRMFPVPVRQAVAVSLRDHFETEADLGNYDELLDRATYERIVRSR